jgi:UDP-N-acetyl-D-mannosaminouronate:lipid I N-acetyl-D-mannosaminouronosyltransferase
MKAIKINEKNIYPFSSRDELIETASSEKKILVAINAEKILNPDIDLKRVINSNIGYPDGIGAIMALKNHGEKNAVKIPGCELWLDIISKYYQSKSFYLIGATQEVITNTVEKLKSDYNGINILNYRNGFIRTEQEKTDLTKDIKDKKPDVVFVAMGSPKQELLMEELQNSHRAVYQGLGGSFDVYIGRLKRAPKIFIKLKLEWLYRLLKEPTRYKRQLKLIKFLFLVKLKRI